MAGPTDATASDKHCSRQREQSSSGRVRADGAPAAKRVLRVDLAALRPAERLGNGWLRAEARIARVGIQEYEDASGKLRRELRLPEDVFAARSRASFALVPLTNTHPPTLLDDKNATFYSVGSISEPAVDGDYLRADVLVTDSAAVRSVESGRVEMSNGYECELDETQDPDLVARWGPYDAIQRDIVGNHCALVDAARAGPEARLRLDGREDAMVASTSRGAREMAQTIKIDGITLDVTDANATAIQQAVDKLLNARGDAANVAALATADALRIAEVRGRYADGLLAILRRGKKRRDAVKARMAACDECDGTGQVEDDAGQMVKCDYCDGAGEYRMHDKMADLSSAKSVEPESKEHGEAGPDETDDEAYDDDDDMDDADELAVAKETEESGGKDVGAARAKKDRIDQRRRARRDSRRDNHHKLVAKARKDRAESMRRRVDRAARARARLELTARTLLGPDWTGKGKNDAAIKREVIVKAFPTAKLDGKKADYVEARYEFAVETLTPLAAGDAARALAGHANNDGAGGNNPPPPSDPDAARRGMIARNANLAAVKPR